MKKLLIVIMHLHMGGAEKSLVNFLSELSPDKLEVDLLLIKKEGELLNQVPSWVNIIDTPKELKYLFKSGVVLSKPILRIVRLMTTVISTIITTHSEERNYVRWKYFYRLFIPKLTTEYDVAASYLTAESMYYVVDKVKAKKKFTWVHTDYEANTMNPQQDEHYFSELEGIITISDKCVNSIINQIPSVSKKVVCLPNIISSELIRRRSEEYVPNEYREDVLKILTVARLEPVKGIDLAVEAAKQLKERKVLFTWYVVGDGSEHSVLVNQIKSMNVTDCFFLLGLRENPYPYIKNCDIVVQPSRFEGKSIALDEAKIMCKTIVATSYPTVKDQLSKNEGLIVEMNGQSIANGIEELYYDKMQRTQLENYLQEHEYGNAYMVDEYMKVLQLDR